LKKDELGRKINSILNEKETFLLSLIMLVHMQEDEKYQDLTELIFLFENYNGFKQFIKFYGGKTINVPTTTEVKQSLRCLDLFQKVYIDHKNFDECYDKLKLLDLGLSKEYCEKEIAKFYEYLKKDGTVTLKQLRRLSKLK
jgi:Ca2+-binding EF-hand superfamily protein